MKTFLLDTKLANTYQVEGLDLSDRIISFDDLGGIWKTTADITIADFWGVDQVAPDFLDENGVSLVIINNQKGKEVQKLLVLSNF